MGLQHRVVWTRASTTILKKIECAAQKECIIMVLSKIIFHVLQDCCIYLPSRCVEGIFRNELRASHPSAGHASIGRSVQPVSSGSQTFKNQKRAGPNRDKFGTGLLAFVWGRFFFRHAARAVTLGSGFCRHSFVVLPALP